MSVLPLENAAGSVTDIPQPPRLSHRARSLLDQMTAAANVEVTLNSRYLVKGWLDRGAMSVAYGPANVGKSFFALDLAYHVASGRDWHGARVNGGAVLYIVAEGGNGFLNRVAAIRDRQSVALWCLPTSLDFCCSGNDSKALGEVLEHLKQHHGDYVLVVVDTLARAMGAGDENASQDMGALIRNIDHLRTATGAHVMLIHHTGKDQAKGARGHSSLRAAVDTEIELSKVGQTITAEARKQRDMLVQKPFAYMLREVELGRDDDGEPVTTCVVAPCDMPTRAPALTATERAVLEALHEFGADHGELNPGGTGWPERGTVSVVNAEEFREFAAGRMHQGEAKRRNEAVKRACDGLSAKGLIGANAGMIWAAKKEGRTVAGSRNVADATGPGFGRGKVARSQQPFRAATFATRPGGAKFEERVPPDLTTLSAGLGLCPLLAEAAA